MLAFEKMKANPGQVAIWICPSDAQDPKISRRRYLVKRSTPILNVTQQAQQFIRGVTQNLIWFVYEHMYPPLDLNSKTGDVYDKYSDAKTGFLILMYHELEASAAAATNASK